MLLIASMRISPAEYADAVFAGCSALYDAVHVSSYSMRAYSRLHALTVTVPATVGESHMMQSVESINSPLFSCLFLSLLCVAAAV